MKKNKRSWLSDEWRPIQNKIETILEDGIYGGVVEDEERFDVIGMTRSILFAINDWLEAEIIKECTEEQDLPTLEELETADSKPLYTKEQMREAIEEAYETSFETTKEWYPDYPETVGDFAERQTGEKQGLFKKYNLLEEEE